MPGLGKSTLALQIASHISSGGTPVLYFALEMSQIWITAKALCREDFAAHRSAAFQAAELLDPRRSAAFPPQVWERVDQARTQVERKGRDLYLYEQSPELTHIGQIQERIRSFRDNHPRQEGPLVVVIDYLQILAPREGALKFSDKQIVDDNVRELCKMRDRDGLIILLISALNRTSYNRPITLESFKESGSIEYSADVILGMQYQGIGGRKFDLEKARQQNPRALELTLLKMRYGQDGARIPLRFYSASSYFQQPDQTVEDDASRVQSLRRQFSAYPQQYHDGFFRRARPIWEDSHA